jgi:hypothetical protein
MIRLTDEQWEPIRKHFPEEHIPDAPVASLFRHARFSKRFCGTDHRRSMAAVLSKLQNGSSPFSELVSQRSVAELLTDVANEIRERGRAR